MERYCWGEHGLFPDIKHLAKVAVRRMTTQPLATHGDHAFDKTKHQIMLPTERDEFPEFYGTVIDKLRAEGTTFRVEKTGPEFYDRQGYPIWPQDIEDMRDGTA